MQLLAAIDKDRFQVFEVTKTSAEVVSSAAWTRQNDLVSSLTNAIGEHQLKNKPLIFGLASELCLACQFKLPTSTAKLRTEAIRFEAERYLPLSAEDFAATFSVSGADVFCVACDRSLVEALAAITPRTAAVLPLALMAARITAGRPESEESKQIAFQLDGRLETVIWAKGPRQWTSTPIDVDVSADASNESDVAAAISIDLAKLLTDSGMPSSSALSEIDLTADPTMLSSGNAQSEQSVQRLCQVIVLAAMVVVFAMLFRRNRIYEHIASVEQSQSEVFGSIFPKARPQGITRKLKSELTRRISFSREVGEWRQQFPEAGSSFVDALQVCLQQKEIVLRQLAVSGESAKIELGCRDKAQAAICVRSLAQAGFVVEAPVVKPHGRIYRATVVAARVEATE